MVHLYDRSGLKGLKWKVNVVIFLGLRKPLIVDVDKTLSLQRFLSLDCLSEMSL